MDAGLNRAGFRGHQIDRNSLDRFVSWTVLRAHGVVER